MKKKDKMLILTILQIVIVLGGFIFSFFIASYLDFIPNYVFCEVNPIFLCEVPILGKVVRILNSGFLTAMFIWVLIVASFYLIVQKSSWNKEFEKLERESTRPETKKEKEKTENIQCLIFAVVFILGMIWVIFFNK